MRQTRNLASERGVDFVTLSALEELDYDKRRLEVFQLETLDSFGSSETQDSNQLALALIQNDGLGRKRINEEVIEHDSASWCLAWLCS